ncbi:PH domain-containing protein [Nocardioides speluncae]|uniref:PH domain-containing protein n=1 Tax=Nocardioides speluncae TaxID=2670337 RepID=UPI000D69B123|nr:PH domain-containing protein [Nocardioides speluncae]
MALLSGLTDPNIKRHLLRDEGEVIVDEVRHHWVVFALPVLEMLVALILILVVPFTRVDLAWFPFVLGIAVLMHAGWKALTQHMDRFVITNMRVFRVNGVFSQKLATMPLIRILDISVIKPWHGRILGFGHFTFESAAQEQGLRDIRYIGRPDERDLTIQRVVQRSGLRGRTPN